MADNITNSPPSVNPGDTGSLAALLKFANQKFAQGMDDMLPAQVIAYDGSTNTATIQPLITMVTTDQQIVPRAQIASCPVYQPSSGGFVRKDPVAAGDFGWIKANDRDISLFKQAEAQSPPNTLRKKSFEDGMFYPQSAWSLITFDPEDENNSVWQNYAGTVKISMWQTLIKILAPKGVGIGGTPNPGGILDLQSTTQAFILPRMTTAQKLAIPNPIEGMTVFDLTEHAQSIYASGHWS